MEEERWNRFMADALRGVRIPYTGKVWLGPEPTVTKPNDGVVFVDLSPAGDDRQHRQLQIRKRNKMPREFEWQ